MTPEQLNILNQKLKCAAECIDKGEPPERTLGFILDAHNIVEHAKKHPAPTKPKFKEYRIITATRSRQMEAIITDQLLRGWKLAGSMFFTSSNEFAQPMILEE